jgi:hypothetical protein
MNRLSKQQRSVAYLDGLQAKVNALRELRAASGAPLRACFAKELPTREICRACIQPFFPVCL